MKVFRNFDLTNYNSYKINSSCNEVYFPENEEDIIEFFKIHKEFILIGSGHNIIFSKEYYDQSMVIFNGNYNAIKLIEQQVIEVEAGAMMWDVAQYALDNFLAGLEIFFDIPSSLGGAVVMNAGASGEEIKIFWLKCAI